MKKTSLQRFVLATIIYAVFAGWLFYPYLSRLSAVQYLFIVNSFLASLGAYILSRRWVYSFIASLLASAIFGFGPFALGLVCYHPFAGIIYASLPWLFCPAAYINKWTNLSEKPAALAAAVASLLPFAAIIAAFEFASTLYLFPIPLQSHPSVKSFIALLCPFAVKPHLFAIGFFHIPLTAFVVGIVLFFKSKRIGATILFATALFASFYKPILNVPPVFWLSICILICSIIIAVGIQSIMLAGKSDSVWLGIAACLAAVCALITLLSAGSFDFGFGFGNVFLQSAKLHVLSTLAILMIFFIARAGLTFHKLRLLTFSAVAVLDIIITTVLIMQKVF